MKLGVTYLAVDEIEMRSDVFSEQQSYWPLPVHETALVTDIVTTPGGSQVSILLLIKTPYFSQQCLERVALWSFKASWNIVKHFLCYE